MIILIILISAILITVGSYDFYLLTPVLIGVINGWINARAINYNKFGKLWHGLQLGILVVILGLLIWFKIVVWNEVLLIISLYYLSFETLLNLLRKPKKVWDYVGHTSTIDKMIRGFLTWIMNIKKRKQKRVPSEGQVRTLGTVIKYFMLFIGLAIYLTDKV